MKLISILFSKLGLGLGLSKVELNLNVGRTQYDYLLKHKLVCKVDHTFLSADKLLWFLLKLAYTLLDTLMTEVFPEIEQV